MTDGEKLKAIMELVTGMSPEFRREVAHQLFGERIAAKELEMYVSTPAEGKIRIDFGIPIAWLDLATPHAVNLACVILEHAGAQIDRVITPATPPQGPV